MTTTCQILDNPYVTYSLLHSNTTQNVRSHEILLLVLNLHHEILGYCCALWKTE